MATSSDLIGLAESHLGEDGAEFWDWYFGGGYANGSATPWCACFVSWCLDQLGVSCVGIPSAYVPGIQAAAAGAGKALSPADAQAGDVVIFDWNANNSGDHVGFCVANHDGWMETVEGNVSNSVGRRTRYWSNVLMAIRPDYDGQAAAPATGGSSSLVIDGNCGPLTCREWQSQLGCQVDGEITGQWSGNKRYTRAASCITDWSNVGQSDTVMAIQHKLGIEVDGYWGHDTSACIQRYLNDRGFDLYIDSDFGPKTASALQQSLNAGQWR